MPMTEINTRTEVRWGHWSIRRPEKRFIVAYAVNTDICMGVGGEAAGTWVLRVPRRRQGRRRELQRATNTAR